MEVGGRLLAALIESKDAIKFFSHKLDERFFIGEEIEAFKFVRDHLSNYHKMPTLETVKAKFPLLPLAPEPVEYYADLVLSRYEYRRLDKVLVEVTDLMKVQDTFTTQALLLEVLAELRAAHSRGAISNFKLDALDMVLHEIKRAQKESVYGLLCGWPTLDKSMLGLRPGDILSLVGRIAMGKTFLLLWVCLHIFMAQKKRVLAVSMEMNSLVIIQRLAALYSKIPIGRIRSGGITAEEVSSLANKLKQAQDEEGELWVVDGNLNATVDDVFTLAYHLRPDVIAIDGAYLLKHSNTRYDKYRRVEANIEDMKNRCSKIGLPMILSYQFNREAAKKQKKSQGKEKGGLEDIAFSDSVGQISSVVLGMFQEENTETLVRREVQVLKGRNGETGKFMINWKFEPQMDMSEIVPDTVSDPKELAYI